MVWKIEYLASVRKAMRKLDRQAAGRILDFMDERVAQLDDPRSVGAALKGMPEKIWRYRVGDYRVLCEIQDGKLVVLVVEIGHRSDVYR